MISVIIPTYNAERYIAETLESVIAQTYTDWECIVVDDGSKDTSAAIVQQYAEREARIHYVYQCNAGPSVARNHGLQLAKGDYIQFLDADDTLYPERFATMLDAYATVNAKTVLYSQFAIGENDDMQHPLPVVVRQLPVPLDHAGMYGYFIAHALFIPACVLFPRDVLTGVEWDTTLSYSEDWDLYLQITKKHNVTFECVPQVLVCYRNTPDSLSKAIFKVYQASALILRRYYKLEYDAQFCYLYANLRYRNIIQNRKYKHKEQYYPLSALSLLQKIKVETQVIGLFVKLYIEILNKKLCQVFHAH